MKIECSICFEKIAEDERQVTVTKCGHLFHSECVGAWVNQSINATCPQCRHAIRAIELRTVFFNTASNRRDSDIFNSSFAVNMRTIQDDLCILQTNLEIQIKNLKAENEELKEQVQRAQHSERQWRNEVDTLTEQVKMIQQSEITWKREANTLKAQVKMIQHSEKTWKTLAEGWESELKSAKKAADSNDRKKATIGKSAALKAIEYVQL